MDSLIAKADAIQPFAKKRRRPSHTTTGKQKKSTAPTDKLDKTTLSISNNVQLPKSMRNITTEKSSESAEKVPTHAHITNRKLRTQLTRTALHNSQSKALLKDAEMFLTEEAGVMEVEGEMERTWRVTQDEIVKAAGQEAAKGRKELKLDGGPYRTRYARNGR
jgi:U3 small nucleolar RNA-associated protein 7